ncbi:MAG: 16S rRNA (guanine(527)-N(7))-methyltransferase RsmG [Ruminococcaceae bacterium]|nr:16S rRNA (guanine(527)-N(7))-methyltransferase RsmG [Oscillospiraceae bacterium]
MNTELFKKILSENSPVQISEEQLNKFAIIAELLSVEGAKYNLTALKTERDVALLHFVDSLTLFSHGLLESGSKIIDVGCGAGFPALVVGAFDPTLKVHALDSTKKKVDFVSLCAENAGLSNMTGICARAEESGFREDFDVALSRGVARLNVLSELCLPLVKIGGTFVAMKGSAGEIEAEEAKRAIEICGGEIEKIHTVKIPEVEHNHTLVVIRKIKETPKVYPRQYSKIVKKPL